MGEYDSYYFSRNKTPNIKYFVFFPWHTFRLYPKVIHAHPLTVKRRLFLGHFSSLWCTFSMHKTSKSSRTFQASDLWMCPSYSAKWCNKTSILTSTDSRTVFVIFYSLCHLETFFPRPHSVMVLFTWPSAKETGLSLLGANPNSNTNVLTHLESNGGVIMRK